ncbi:MAG: hypothetical protein JWO20_1979 [Candidatus Angelobacter sp.]|jgi:hypothetical protein|nr:hypothetical protein [Candidatus Angelobacter sp.]
MLIRLAIFVFSSALLIAQGVPSWVTEPKPEKGSVDSKQALRAAERDFSGPALEKLTPGQGTAGFAYATRRESLPFNESTLVIVGSVDSQQPYFNRSHSAVYSELNVKVSEVLKDENFLNGEPTVTVVRSGGALTLKNGKIVRSMNVEGENHLDLGRKYLLFLACKSESRACDVLTSWDLTSGKAVPLAIGDVQDLQRHRSVLAGMDESSFLETVRIAAEKVSKAVKAAR